MIRILLYSSEPVLAQGLASALIGKSDCRLVSVVTSDDDLAAAVAIEKPDILLLDLTSGLSFESLRELKERDDRCKLLLWVNGISTELAFQAMELGVRGIARRTLPTEILMECLRKVSQGELWLEKTLTDSMLSARKVSLTPREGQLITLLTQGLKNKEVATVMSVSESTVKVYLSRLFAKVGVKDRFELAIYGLRCVTAGQGRLDHPERKSHGPQAALRTLRLTGLRSLVLDIPGIPWTDRLVPAPPLFA
jgi:DNA-binding NarL/FixJ family response regulator